MRINKFAQLLFICLFFGILILPVAQAELSFDTKDNFSGWGSVSSLRLSQQDATPLAIALNLINTALTFLGLISSGFILYAGLLWFTARENEEQVKKALDIIKGAVIGLGLVLLSYGISFTVYSIFLSSSVST
ncbi:MAG: hypothetical protein WC752_00565 [Patescibacteria group bacterium]|jgi:hypothetical protein